MLFFGKTDVGRVRDNNQDSFFAGYLELECAESIFLAVVCDGMGGANGGNIASSLAVETFRRELTEGLKTLLRDNHPSDTCESILAYALRCANNAVYEKASEDKTLKGMGTTLVAILLFDNMIYAVNVGDSRLYVSAHEGLCQLSHDHSYVQTLVDKGKISPEEAKTHPNKNVIMRAVGTEPEVKADFYKIFPDKKSFLLCTDGLSNYVEPDELRGMIENSETLEGAVGKMIDSANKNGGNDNITAVLVRM